MYNKIIPSSYEVGAGLRFDHLDFWQEQRTIPPLELLADNILNHEGGDYLYKISQIVERTSSTLHCTTLNIAGTDPIDTGRVEDLRRLKEQWGAYAISDHLCFSQKSGGRVFDLLPPRYTTSEVARISERILAIQEILAGYLTIENISSYVSYDNHMSEAEFISALVQETGCKVLLDVNNVFVSCHNNGTSPDKELAKFPSQAIQYYHVAGHRAQEGLLVDTHDQLISDSVLRLLGKAMNLHGIKPVIFERDDNHTSTVMVSELNRIHSFLGEYCHEPSPPTEVILPQFSHDTNKNQQRALEEASFIAAIHASDPAGGSPVKLPMGVVDGAAMIIYQQAFVASLTETPLTTVFAPLASYFDGDILRHLLWQYFQEYPPNQLELVDCLRGFPSFIETYDTNLGVLAEVATICLYQWDLLSSADRENTPLNLERLETIFLHRTSQLVHCPQGGLSIWLEEDGHELGMFIKQPGPGGEVCLVPLPREALAPCQSLVKGASLLEVCHNPEVQDTISPQIFEDILKTIAMGMCHVL